MLVNATFVFCDLALIAHKFNIGLGASVFWSRGTQEAGSSEHDV
jgi:hypothetical protein